MRKRTEEKKTLGPPDSCPNSGHENRPRQPLGEPQPMAKPPKNLWKRIVHHFRAPTFEELLEESSESLDNQPVQMNCPRCGETVPFTDNCPNCGSPRHPTIDQGV